MAKATMSKDGELRVDLRITYRLGLYELGALLVKNTAPYWGGEGYPPDFTSKAQAADAVREAIQHWGDQAEGWSDHLDSEQADAWEAWARRQVLLAYPDLEPQEADRG